ENEEVKDFTATISNRGRHQIQIAGARIEYAQMNDALDRLWMWDYGQTVASMLVPGAAIHKFLMVRNGEPPWGAAWYRAVVHLSNDKLVRSKKVKVTSRRS